MSNWPPDPNKKPDNNQPAPSSGSRQDTPNNISGREWQVIEKALLAGVEEQRRARRWGIFFKLLTFGYIIVIFLVMGRGCSTTQNTTLKGVESNQPHIAVVDLQGVISANDAANAYSISSALTEAYEAKNTKAVVLNINSPGGSPVQSDDIWQTIMTLRKEYPNKKLYAVIGDIGASGAYYIASAADEIYVNKSSIVGSIGVIMPNYNIEGFMDKLGVKDRTLTAGQYKDILTLSRPMTEFEQQHVKSVLDNTHKHFIDAVKTGRGKKLKDTEANNLFSGLFWTGEQSIKLGLADKVGNLYTVQKEVDIDNVVNYTPVDPMQKFFESLAVKLGVGIGTSIDMKLLPEDYTQAKMR